MSPPGAASFAAYSSTDSQVSARSVQWSPSWLAPAPAREGPVRRAATLRAASQSVTSHSGFHRSPTIPAGTDAPPGSNSQHVPRWLRATWVAARTSAFIEVDTTAPGAYATLGMITDWVLPDPGGPITRAAPRALAATTAAVSSTPKYPPSTTGTARPAAPTCEIWCCGGGNVLVKVVALEDSWGTVRVCDAIAVAGPAALVVRGPVAGAGWLTWWRCPKYPAT